MKTSATNSPLLNFFPASRESYVCRWFPRKIAPGIVMRERSEFRRREIPCAYERLFEEREDERGMYTYKQEERVVFTCYPLPLTHVFFCRFVAFAKYCPCGSAPHSASMPSHSRQSKFPQTTPPWRAALFFIAPTHSGKSLRLTCPARYGISSGTSWRLSRAQRGVPQRLFAVGTCAPILTRRFWWVLPAVVPTRANSFWDELRHSLLVDCFATAARMSTLPRRLRLP